MVAGIFFSVPGTAARAASHINSSTPACTGLSTSLNGSKTLRRPRRVVDHAVHELQIEVLVMKPARSPSSWCDRPPVPIYLLLLSQLRIGVRHRLTERHSNAWLEGGNPRC